MSGGDGQKMSKGRQPSLSVEEASGGGDNIEEEGLLKKGPWTSTEDAILVEYLQKHGEGDWNAIQKNTGLARSGKSCRLRWVNHLRPDLRKGSFTQEEEQKILELHLKMGNKWSRMALELPGRTDNEIKNYWNARVRKLQKAGLPIYPADLSQRLLNDSQESPNVASQHSDTSQSEHDKIPEVRFKNLKLTPDYLYNGPPSISIPESYNTMFPIMPHKRLRESDTSYNSLDGSISTAVPEFNPYVNYSSENISDLPKLFSPYDSNLNTNDQFHDGYLPGSHAGLTGNTSSVPMSGDMKLELPSFQYLDTQRVSSGTPASRLPSLESVDTLIQSPPAEQTQSYPVSSQIDGLLESVVYGSMIKRGANSNLLQETSDNCMPRSSTINPFDTGWDEQGDPSSSGASVLTANTPVSMGSEDEPLSVKTIQDNYVRYKTVFRDPTYLSRKKEYVRQIDFTRPYKFDSRWDEQGYPNSFGASVLTTNTPISMGSVHGPQSFETIKDHDVIQETVFQDPTYFSRKKEYVKQIDFTRPYDLFDLGWEEQGYPSSSSASVLTANTPISMGSVDEPQSVETIQDHDVRHETVFQDPTYFFRKKNYVKQIDFTRPYALFDSGLDDKGYPSSSGASVLNIHTPISMGSVDEPLSVETIPGHDVRHETVFQYPTHFSRKKEYVKQIDFTRPYALFDSGWDEQGYPSSSGASVLTANTPISMGSVDEPQSMETIQDHDVRHKTVFQDPTYFSKKKEYVKQIDFTRPYALFDSDCYMNPDDDSKDQSFLKDDLGALDPSDFHGYH